MIYMSGDIETTGLNPETCQILQVAFVFEDTEINPLPEIKDLPVFKAYVKHNEYTGSDFALDMNKDIFHYLKQHSGKSSVETIDGELVVPNYLLADVFSAWILKTFEKPIIDKYTKGSKFSFPVAGKNFGSFDKVFLQKLPHWSKSFILSHRTLDPSILYTNFTDDVMIPSTQTCMDRYYTDQPGLKIVSHDAYDDAVEVIKLLRPLYTSQIRKVA